MMTAPVATYQSIYCDAGDDSPLESPQDEHGQSNDDADLPCIVLCRMHTNTHGHQICPLSYVRVTLLLPLLETNEL